MQKCQQEVFLFSRSVAAPGGIFYPVVFFIRWYFPNRSLLLRVLMGVKRVDPEKHTERGPARMVARPGTANALFN